MAVSLTKVYSDIVVQDVGATLVFPPDVVGSIKPGSLDHLTKAHIIRWGVNMTGPIEPGTIPECCNYLLFPETYSHAIDNIKLRPRIEIYVHRTQVQTGPSDRIFYAWGLPDEPQPILPAGYQFAAKRIWRQSIMFGDLNITEVESVPKLAVPEPAVPEPYVAAGPIQALEKKIDGLGTSLDSVKESVTDISGAVSAIKELVDARSAEATQFETQVTADFESIKSTIAALDAKLDQFVRALSP